MVCVSVGHCEDVPLILSKIQSLKRVLSREVILCLMCCNRTTVVNA